LTVNQFIQSFVHCRVGKQFFESLVLNPLLIQRWIRSNAADDCAQATKRYSDSATALFPTLAALAG
jgi:hypothetical protein